MPERHYLAICAIMKNEAQNILEWISYHHALGVEKFYLYDNNSIDNVQEVLRVPIDKGLVDYIPWPINPGQIEAYADCVTRHREDCTWMAFIDLDEFINPFGYGSILEWLRNYEDYSAVAIQWMNYGPSGHDTPPPGLLIENYLHRFPEIYGVHGHVKTILKPKDFIRPVSPHAFEVTGQIVDEYKVPVVMTGVEYSIQPVQLHTEVCLNHYYTRSRAEWIAKVDRGMADSAIDEPNRRNMAWIEIYERDAIEYDDKITKFAEATRKVLRELKPSIVETVS